MTKQQWRNHYIRSNTLGIAIITPILMILTGVVWDIFTSSESLTSDEMIFYGGAFISSLFIWFFFMIGNWKNAA